MFDPVTGPENLRAIREVALSPREVLTLAAMNAEREAEERAADAAHLLQRASQLQDSATELRRHAAECRAAAIALADVIAVRV